MLKGLRNHYLAIKDSPYAVTEGNVVEAVMGRYKEMEGVTTPWRNLWANILRLYFPTLNNVYHEGTGGQIKVNEVWTSEPATNLIKLVNYYHTLMFPEAYPWAFVEPTDQGGIVIDKGKLSTAMIEHCDHGIEVVREMLSEGDFSGASFDMILHNLLLGNAPIRAIPVGNRQLHYKHCPVHRMNVQRDNLGMVYAISWMEALDKWQIVRDYGMDTYNLFITPNDHKLADPSFVTEYSRIFSGGGAGGYSAGGGMTGQPIGTVSQTVKRDVENVIRLMLPNDMATGIPGAGRLFPELKYVCYLVTERSKRLVDVEYFPVIPIGVASDIQVVGEEYARGMCGMLLPNAAVLNRKKRASYYAESKIANSPMVMSGQGFTNKQQNDFRENEVLHLSQGSNIQPMFDAGAIFRQKQAFYESDRVALERAMGVDRVEVEQSDRMTLGEYTQRRDTAGQGFSPFALRCYKAVIPILNATLQYAYMSGRLPTPPQEMLMQGIDFKFKVTSAFTYGQHSEKGMNFQRALAPLGEAFSIQPELLDHIDFESVLRRNFASFELGNSLNTMDKVHQIRKDRAIRQQRQAEAQGGMQEDPMDKGRNAAEVKRSEENTASGPESGITYAPAA